MSLFDDTRSAWGARPPKNGGFPNVSAGARKGRMWHWNGPAVGIGSKPHSACLAAVRSDQAFHQNTRGWRDVGYNALVCPHGRAVEGAGVDKVAAHCAGFNTSHYGIQLMVGQGEHPTAAMLARAVRLSADLQARSGHTLQDLGHRDGFATTCPGDEIYRWARHGGPTGGISGSVGSGGSTPIGAGGSGGSTVKDWFDMASDADLERIVRKVILDPATLKEIARYVSTGYPIGPDGDQQVLGGWAYLAAHAAKAALEAIGQESDSAQVKAAVEEALAGYSLTLSKNGAQS